jgi:hypothetical protein
MCDHGFPINRAHDNIDLDIETGAGNNDCYKSFRHVGYLPS